MSKYEEYDDETDKDEKSRRPLGTEMQCRNCIFWSLEEWKLEKKLIDPDPDLPDIWGECRRNAPVASTERWGKIGDLLGSIAWATEEFANIEHNKFNTPYDFSGDNNDGSHHHVWFWPETQPYSWCGEFKAGRRFMSEENITRFEKLHDEWVGEDKNDLETQTVDDQRGSAGAQD